MYKPFVIKLPTNNNDFKKYSTDVKISSNINRPLFTLGFHHFQHRTKSALKIIDNLETKKKFYNIVNNFDPDNIDIGTKTLSNNYFKLWEMLSLFDIASDDKLSTAIIGVGSGGFLQSYIDFRDKYFSAKNDKIFTVTMKPEDKSVNDLNKSYMGRIKKTHNVIPHKTSKIEVAQKYTGKDNGDIKDFKTIKNFKNDLVKEKVLANLVIGNGKHKILNNNYIEQESYQLIFGEIVAMLNIIKKDGHFVLRVFDTYTPVSLKYLYLLSTLFEDVYIYKPYTSYGNDEEKYIVCKKFKYNNKDIDIKNYQTMLESMDTDKFIGDIFTNLTVPDDFTNIVKYSNIKLSNELQIIINKMVTFIKSNNYFGTEFHEYKDNQENAHKYWLSVFNKDNLTNTNLITEQSKYNDSEIKIFTQSLILT